MSILPDGQGPDEPRCEESTQAKSAHIDKKTWEVVWGNPENRADVYNAAYVLAEVLVERGPVGFIMELLGSAAECEEVDDAHLREEVRAGLVMAAERCADPVAPWMAAKVECEFGTPRKPRPPYGQHEDAFDSLTREALGGTLRLPSSLGFDERQRVAGIIKCVARVAAEARSPDAFIQLLLYPSLGGRTNKEEVLHAFRAFKAARDEEDEDAGRIPQMDPRGEPGSHWLDRDGIEDDFQVLRRVADYGTVKDAHALSNVAFETFKAFEEHDHVYPVDSVTNLLMPAAAAIGLNRRAAREIVEFAAEKANPTFRDVAPLYSVQRRDFGEMMIEEAEGRRPKRQSPAALPAPRGGEPPAEIYKLPAQPRSAKQDRLEAARKRYHGGGES